MVYIQNDIILGYTIQTLNIFNSHLFFNVGFTLTHTYFSMWDLPTVFQNKLTIIVIRKQLEYLMALNHQIILHKNIYRVYNIV